MKKRILVFDTDISGHHIEYIHHVLLKANSSDDDYIFYLPAKFNDFKGTTLDWHYNNNVTFFLYDAVDNVKNSSILVSSYQKCRTLKRALANFNATHVFLISLMPFIPFLPLFIRGNIKVSGIIYQIYLYRWRCSSFKQRILDVCKYIVITYSKCIDTVYILNDECSALRLNQLYGTSKYKFLVDPYVPLPASSHDLGSYSIDINNTIFLHFGSLSERKGTLDILSAILLLKQSVLCKSTFIFAGKVSKEISVTFYELVNKIKTNTESQLIVIDQFCPYDLIASLCVRADLLLMPYKVVSQSSGILGYAAQYNTPVLASSKGLIGKLVRKYKLGYLINNVTPLDIADFLNEDIKYEDMDVSKNYLKVNTVDNFISGIHF